MSQLINGDCLTELSKIEDRSLDLVITDPPYGVLKDMEWDQVDIVSFTQSWWNLLVPKLKPDSSVYIFWSQKYIKEGFDIFKPDRMLVWHHPNLATLTNKMFLWTYDPVFYIKFGKPQFTANFKEKENVDVFRFAKPQKNFKRDHKYHPSSKPVDLVRNFIRISSLPDSQVLDPFAGGGVLGEACELEGRNNYTLIEKEKEYFDIIKDRLSKYDK